MYWYEASEFNSCHNFVPICLRNASGQLLQQQLEGVAVVNQVSGAFWRETNLISSWENSYGV